MEKGFLKVSQLLSERAGLSIQVAGAQVTELSLPRDRKGKKGDILHLWVHQNMRSIQGLKGIFSDEKVLKNDCGDVFTTLHIS